MKIGTLINEDGASGAVWGFSVSIRTLSCMFYERVWDGINNLHISAVILPTEQQRSNFLCLSPGVTPTLPHLAVVPGDTTILALL